MPHSLLEADEVAHGQEEHQQPHTIGTDAAGGKVEMDQVALTQLHHRDAQHFSRRCASDGRQQQLKRGVSLALNAVA